MTLPTLLLYDEKGLKLFEEITYTEEYYPTAAEIEVLQVYANDIVKAVEAEAFLVELGAGFAAEAIGLCSTDRAAAIFAKSRSFSMHSRKLKNR